MVINCLNDMLQDGYTRKFATYYLGVLERDKNALAFSPSFVDWAHSHGFLADHAAIYDVSEENYEQYLSDYDYYKVWPLNNWTRIWINDKLTLKYMLANTRFDNFMPKYYFYTAQEGLRVLVDASIKNDDDEMLGFVNQLKEVGAFACKPNNGAMSEGFYKLSYCDEEFYIDDKTVTIEDIKEFVMTHKNYVFTEFLTSGKAIRELSPQVPTLRLMVLNENGRNPIIVRAWMRFSNDLSGTSNYVTLDGSSLDKYTIITYVNPETGDFGNTKAVYADHIEDIDCHPNTKALLRGTIEDYDLLKENVLEIANRFPTLEWMGFDIGITDDGFKCMEINSHPGIKYTQMFEPLYKDSIAGTYFKRKIVEIDNLSEEEKCRRNDILR